MITGKIIRVCLISVFLLLFFNLSVAQRPKVGIVLSGGGASGLAHIGFLRALEENNIPIDYISGTSMGAFVGALYASGYTPDQIEAIFSSDEFKLWSSGKIDEEYKHYFKKRPDDGSWVRIKFTLDSILETNLPTNLINSTALNYGLMELFSGPTNAGGNNFDSLMIPFRCVASDIVKKQSFVFKEGDLATAIRASLSYPFFLSPVSLDGMLLYDGGLYDNFPVGTLCSSFEPDYIIGCNVSYNYPKPDEDNVLSQVRSMMSDDTKYSIDCEKGFIIEPPVSELGVLEFRNIDEVVEQGYQSTIDKMDSIKSSYPYDYQRSMLEKKRERFRSSIPETIISSVEILGLKKAEKNYIRSSIRFRAGDSLDISEIRSKIMKLASDEKIKQIRPELVYSEVKKGYVLKLYVKPEKKMFISFGGNISTKAINEGFVGVQYNHLSYTPMTLYGNTYFGRFYSSGHGIVRLDVPTRIPFGVYGSYTLSKWDYFQNSNILVEQSSPSYMIHKDSYGRLGMTFPISYKGKLDIGASFGDIKYEYYQNNNFTRFDTADVTDFLNSTYHIKYERNSLNRKQYPDHGGHFYLKAMYINGRERTDPGSATPDDTVRIADREWFVLRGKYDQYFAPGNRLKFGILIEGAYSEQPFFSNYASSILAAPSFEPIPESRTVFRSRFRAHQWGAIGIRTILTPIRNFDMRLEGFMFQPLRQISADADYKAYYDATGSHRNFIGSFTMVYSMAFTQIAVNLNYYDNFNENFPTNNTENFTVMLHLGFILFNDKMLE